MILIVMAIKEAVRRGKLCYYLQTSLFCYFTIIVTCACFIFTLSLKSKSVSC